MTRDHGNIKNHHGIGHDQKDHGQHINDQDNKLIKLLYLINLL